MRWGGNQAKRSPTRDNHSGSKIIPLEEKQGISICKAELLTIESSMRSQRTEQARIQQSAGYSNKVQVLPLSRRNPIVEKILYHSKSIKKKKKKREQYILFDTVLLDTVYWCPLSFLAIAKSFYLILNLWYKVYRVFLYGHGTPHHLTRP